MLFPSGAASNPDGELCMPADYTIYWKPDAVRTIDGRPLRYAASNQLDAVCLGDRLWVITVDEGNLVVAGSITIGTLTGREGAEILLGPDDLWPARYYAIARAGTEMNARRMPGDAIAGDLRFDSAIADRLTLVDGKVDGRQFQTMRKLRSASVKLLEELLGLAEGQPGALTEQLRS